MTYRLLADLLLLLHLGFIVFVVAGGLAALRRPRLAWVHLPAALWGAGIELTGGVCPLTPLELRLRSLGGEAGYVGDFVGHYLVALIYPPGLTRELQIGLGALVLAVNAAVYARLWVRWRRARKMR